jgi:hypothetical protein
MRFRLSALTTLLVTNIVLYATLAHAPTNVLTSNAERLAALQLSKMCADEGNQYATRATPDDKTALFTPSTHYNRVMSRCLVELITTKVDAVTGVRMLTTNIYDAIEDVPLAAYFTITANGNTTVESWYTTNADNNQVPCVSDKRHVSIALTVFQPYRNRLMNQ